MGTDTIELILKFILCFIGIYYAYRISNNIIKVIENKNRINADIMIRDTKYSEEEIIKHLNYIIKEALDDYVIYTLTPKNIYYINNKIENEIIVYLTEEVSNRLSVTLRTQLSFIYNEEYIGKFLGRHIYATVLDFVLQYNMDNADKVKK